jgi:arylsulfatase A-like enzyme
MLAPSRRGFLGSLAAPLLQAQPRKPNIVLILADDLGWADLASYGADVHQTPQTDRLARQAIRFTNAYAAAPVCSPTRASIMTGKHPARLGITIWHEAAMTPPPGRKLIPPKAEGNLPHDETTLAEVLRESGYLTALIGKWHLGTAGYYPETQGFDVNIGGTHWGAPQTFFWPYRGERHFNRERRYVPGLPFGKPDEYLTDRLTDEAIRVIDHVGQQPFFLYLAHHAPHTPIEGKPEIVARYQRRIGARSRHRNAAYAAMVESFDESVGRVMAHLEKKSMLDNTIFVVTSDNGGYINEFAGTPVTNNAPLRSGKGSLYEGGVRVPLLIRWPGWTRAGAICDEPVVSTDLFPTLLDLSGSRHRPPEDGISLRPVLEDPSVRMGRDSLYFHYPHYYPTTSPVSAIRSGDWKLIEYFEDNHVELYNLREDLAESRDLASAMPDQAAALRSKLDSWRKSVGARMPSANPSAR